jgi:predicted nucleic acid-binding protein
MILYLDTSSLVKRYVEEEHSDLVREWVAAVEFLASSRVAFPETLSALARRTRRGDLDETSFAILREDFESSWSSFLRLDLDEQRAGQLAVRYLLRGFDAVHLAAACGLRDAAPPGAVLFASFDLALLRAAQAEGIDCMDIEPTGSKVMEAPPPYASSSE